MRDGERAKKAFQRALAINATDAEALALYSTFLRQWTKETGATQTEEVIEYMSQALELDEVQPNSIIIKNVTYFRLLTSFSLYSILRTKFTAVEI